MSGDVFVDTSGWYALIDRNDSEHAAVTKLVQRILTGGARLVTSDYVIDESCTLAKARAGAIAATRLLELTEQTGLDLEWIGPEHFDAAKRSFRKFHDEAFSFYRLHELLTDCTSFAVMRELNISEAITSDDHFRIAGFQPLLRASQK